MEEPKGSAMDIFYSPSCLAYRSPGHPESPERIGSTAEFLRSKGCFFRTPAPCSEEDLLRVHDPEMIRAVRDGVFFDPDTPPLPGMFEHARLAAGSAVCAMRSAVGGTTAFSLMRPPGHHATRNRMMGFCYFNNTAVAAAVYLAGHPAGKIAVLDIDCHHGNGTENIFFDWDGILYVSLHQSPLYPGTGLESRNNCLNYPLPPFTDGIKYLETLETACGKIVDFNPDLIGVSAGFDAHEDDPLAQMKLTVKNYEEIGAAVASMGKSVFIVMEGGYGKKLPYCVFKFLKALSS